MDRKAQIIKNYIYNSAYELLRLLAPLITTPYVSRILGATGIGIYSYTQSIATYFILLGAVGTTLYGQREIAYVQDDPVERTKVFWEITIFRFFSVGICTIIYYCIFGISGEYAQIYTILTFEILATAFDVSWFFMGMENFKLTVIRNTIIKLVGIVLIFVLVKRPEDVPIYTLCLTLPIFIGNISLWFSLPKYLVRLHGSVFSGISRHFKPISVLFLPQVAVEVYTVLDKTMLGVLSTVDQVGYYTQAQKIIKILLMIVTSFGTVMLPAMSAAFAQGKINEIKKNIRQAFKLIFLISFALIFGICSIVSRFVPVFFGQGYELVTPLIIVISPILVVIGMSNVMGKQYLLPTKQQSSYTISICTGAVVNFVLNCVLIPKFDAIGASIATVLAEMSVTGVQCWHVRKQLNLKEYLGSFFRYFLMGFIMFAIVWGLGRVLPLNAFSLVVMVIVGIAVYLLELIITKDDMLRLGINMIRKKVKKQEA